MRSVKRQKEAVKRPLAGAALSGVAGALSCGREKFVCRAGEEKFPADVSCRWEKFPAGVSCGRGGVSSGRVVREGGAPADVLCGREGFPAGGRRGAD